MADLGRVNVLSLGQLPVFVCSNSNTAAGWRGTNTPCLMSFPLLCSQHTNPDHLDKAETCPALFTQYCSEHSFGHEFSLSLPHIASHCAYIPTICPLCQCASGLQSEKDQIRQESWHRWQASRQAMASYLAWFESASQNYLFLVKKKEI